MITFRKNISNLKKNIITELVRLSCLKELENVSIELDLGDFLFFTHILLDITEC